MIKAYFDSGKHSEWVATFNDEETYMKCVPVLEKLAKESRMELVESTELEEEEDGAEEIHKQAVLDHQYENLKEEK